MNLIETRIAEVVRLLERRNGTCNQSDETHFEISNDCDANLKDIYRSIEGRRYITQERTWRFHLILLGELIDKLRIWNNPEQFRIMAGQIEEIETKIGLHSAELEQCLARIHNLENLNLNH